MSQPDRQTLDSAEAALLREFPDWRERWPDLHVRTVAAIVLRDRIHRGRPVKPGLIAHESPRR